MRFVVHTLMFLACMLYGAMPAQAALSMAVPVKATAHVADLAESTHGGHVMPMAQPERADRGDPCPHRGTMTHAPFCTACLVLIPELRFAQKGSPPHAYPKPDLQRAFFGTIAAPPLPPPRA